MDITIGKSKVKGAVSVPSSKSLLQRYMIAGLLAGGETTLNDVRHCKDTLACFAAIQSLEDEPISGENPLSIKGGRGKINSSNDIIHCGESGFALRALSAVAALASKQITLTGSGSLLRRPVDFFEKVFPQLNVECKTNGGFLPLNIRGPIQFKNISIDGSLSSQFLSGLLMVYPLAAEDHVIEVKNLKSRQYIDLTLQVMKKFGVTVTHDSYRQFFIPGNQKYMATSVNVEGDWSAASFMLVAGATAGEVTIEDLSMDSLQPDRAIIGILKNCGADVIQHANSVSVISANLKSFTFDATDCPDLFPPLVALGLRCNGNSMVAGVERLIHKESNRALALQQEFSKMNDKLISIEGNTMIIRGGLPLQTANVSSHNDHRIAMALAVAGLNVEGGINISGCEAIDKSYPEFFKELTRCMVTE